MPGPVDWVPDVTPVVGLPGPVLGPALVPALPPEPVALSPQPRSAIPKKPRRNVRIARWYPLAREGRRRKATRSSLSLSLEVVDRLERLRGPVVSAEPRAIGAGEHDVGV